MIDIENELFTQVFEEVTAEFPDAFVTGEYINAPPAFPCLFFMEADNSVRSSTIDSGGIENFADVLYEASVYSASQSGKKSQCKAILAIVDRVMARNGLVRTMKKPVPNYLDSSVYRMVARYRASVSKNNIIYGR